jgi:hypothetical protein
MNLRVGQQVRIRFAPRTSRGLGARVTPGSVRWRSSDPAVASVTPDPSNELSATVNGHSPGVVLITSEAEIESEGRHTVPGATSLIVYDGALGHGSELSFGTPEDS